MGELPTIAEETSSKKTANRRVKKTSSSKRKSEDESEADEESEEHISNYDSDSTCSGDSEDSMMGVQCYKELPRPRKGMEHLWNRVNRGGLDITDNIRLHVVAVCCGDDGALYFKYYDTGRFIAGPPKNSDDYEYTLCDEMDPHSTEQHANCWMQWDPVPDSTCSIANNNAGRARRCPNGRSERPPPTWKGYVVLTPEEEEQLEKERELAEEVTSQRRRTRRTN